MSNGKKYVFSPFIPDIITREQYDKILAAALYWIRKRNKEKQNG